MERGSDVKIEVYAEYKAGAECIARKTRKLASLISADGPGEFQAGFLCQDVDSRSIVRLDAVGSRTATAPILSLEATVKSFDQNIGGDVNELSKSLALSEKWLALGDYVRRVVKIGGIVAEVRVTSRVWHTDSKRCCCRLTRWQRRYSRSSNLVWMYEPTPSPYGPILTGCRT